MARHAREVTDFLITNLGLTMMPVDEMWSFVLKNKRKLTREIVTEIDNVERIFKRQKRSA